MTKKWLISSVLIKNSSLKPVKLQPFWPPKPSIEPQKLFLRATSFTHKSVHLNTHAESASSRKKEMATAT